MKLTPNPRVWLDSASRTGAIARGGSASAGWTAWPLARATASRRLGVAETLPIGAS